MKKLLIPLICGLLATWACTPFENEYHAENMQDIITIRENLMVNDYGVVYTLKEKASASIPALEEGKRYFIVFDVLNQQMDIRLNMLLNVDITTPRALPEDQEIAGNDPVVFQFNSVGKLYWDLGITTYKAKNSTFEHKLSYYYTIQPGENKLILHIYHEGNNENPSTLTNDQLEAETHIISIPMANFKDVNDYGVCCDVLVKNAESGKYEVARRSF